MKMMRFFLAGILACSLALAPCIYAASEQLREMGKELQAEAQPMAAPQQQQNAKPMQDPTASEDVSADCL